MKIHYFDRCAVFMADIEQYALVTVDMGKNTLIDIKVDRKLTMKKMIIALYDAINKDISHVNGFFVKAKNNGKLLSQNDTLNDFDIYDGEVLRIL